MSTELLVRAALRLCVAVTAAVTIAGYLLVVWLRMTFTPDLGAPRTLIAVGGGFVVGVLACRAGLGAGLWRYRTGLRTP